MGLHGPLVLDTTPVEVADPELARWLDRGETVMMCMGTHYHYTESQVRAVINGFLGAIDSNSRIQFFWKLSGRVSFEGMIGELLANPRDRQRFRIVDWIDADPAAVMAHPNLVTGVRIRITNPLGEFQGMRAMVLVVAQVSMKVRAYHKSSSHNGLTCTIWLPGQSTGGSVYLATQKSHLVLRRSSLALQLQDSSSPEKSWTGSGRKCNKSGSCVKRLEGSGRQLIK